MIVGLVPPPPPPPPPFTVPAPGANGGATAGRRRRGSGEGSCCTAADAAIGVPLDLSNNGVTGGRDASGSGSLPSSSAVAATPRTPPCTQPDKGSDRPPPPPPHPVFGRPKGKTFGGGGGGKLVEALRPLMSGNTRTWLVVSVGGNGTSGPGAAWRALDVARRATGISTTCIRLRLVFYFYFIFIFADEMRIVRSRYLYQYACILRKKLSCKNKKGSSVFGKTSRCRRPYHMLRKLANMGEFGRASVKCPSVVRCLPLPSRRALP